MNEETEEIPICHRCKTQHRNNEILKYERSNGLFPSPAPYDLPKLTPEEEMMICRIDMSAKVYVKKYGMIGLVGSIIHFPKDY